MKNSIKLNGALNVIQKSCNIFFPLIVFSYISRALGPEKYGEISFANSIISYFLLTTMLGVNTYAVREGASFREDKNKIESFAKEIFSINFCSLLISYGMLLLLIFFSETLYKYKNLLLILSLVLPCTLLGREWINTIYEDYLYMTVRYIIIQLLGIGLIFTFIHNEEDYIKYTLIYMLTSSVGYLINLIYTKKYVSLNFTTNMNLKQHIIPILILFCGQIATTIYIQSDITILGLLKTENEVGIYTVASKIYVLAKGMINALTAVAIPRIVFFLGKHDNEKYNEFSNKLVKYLFLLVLPLMVGMIFLSDNIILIVGGSQYIQGNWSLKILGIALVFAVFSGFYCNAILIPNRKEKIFLIITVIAAIINVALNITFIPFIGIEGAALTTLFSEIVVFILAKICAKNYVLIVFDRRDVFSIVIGSIVVALVCATSKYIVKNIILEFFLAMGSSLILYFVILLTMKNQLAVAMYRQLILKLKK